MALAESSAPALPLPPIPTFRAEQKLFRAGFRRVAGVDEAGRGPLAGPVVAAAVILDPKCIPRGLADSKLLQPAERESLFEKICATAEVSFAFGSVAAIDSINILQATLVAMRRAVMGLAMPPDAVLIDGNVLPRGLPCEARAVVGGDATCKSVAAASIVAKVVRDRLMARCDGAFAGYGLASHKGYSTKAHQAALQDLGPCRLHRRSFWRVAAFYDEQPPLPWGEGVAEADGVIPYKHAPKTSPLVGEGAREAGGRGVEGKASRHPPPVVSQGETTPSPTRGEG